MSLTLGEKLRQAREAKGIKVSEVAEQTRISPLYIESIENDDYRALPGGIFNRGFVKSFAKYVGVDEQEALSDYATLLYETEGDVENVKFHRPEVLTDDRTSSSMLPTLIVAAVILGIMTVGVLFVLKQFQTSEITPDRATPKPTTSSTDTNSSGQVESTPTTPSGVADIATAKFEFKAVGHSVALTVMVDGKTVNNTITPGSTTMFEPKESIKFSYSKWVADFAELAINGKNIILPKTPLNPKRANIEIEINQENLDDILNSGKITAEVAATNLSGIPNMGSPALESPAPTQIPSSSPRPNIAPNKAIRQQTTNKVSETPKPSGTPKTPVPARPSPNRPQ